MQPQMQSAIQPPMGQQPMGGHMQMQQPMQQQQPSSVNSRTGPMGGVYSDIVQSPQGPPQMGQQPFGSAPGPVPTMPAAQRPGSSGQRHERSFSHSSAFSQSNNMPAQQQQQQQQQQYPVRNSAQASIPSSRFNNSMGPSQAPPQLFSLPFQQQQQQQQQQPPSQPPFQQPQPPQMQSAQQGAPNPLMQHPPANRPGSSGLAAAQGRNQSPPQMAPSRPVFGLSLNRLYERDGLAVPMVVYQCIQAVDLYGLGVEGIYRLSGSVPHVNKLKGMFDTGKKTLAPTPTITQAVFRRRAANTLPPPPPLRQTRARRISTLGIPRTSSTTSIV